MSKYKVHIAPKLPKEEEISRHKDFNRVLRQHTYRRNRRQGPSAHQTLQKVARWLPVLLLAILLLVILYFFSGFPKQKQRKENNISVPTSMVESPHKYTNQP